MTVVRDTTTTNDVTTNAHFEAWATAIHNALTSVGLVQTADTGQITLAGVANPGANTFAGYEIWRFADANQSADPIFFKLEYGCGTAVSRPALRWTFGDGSNGTGTLTNGSTVQTEATSVTTPSGPELHVCHIAGTLVVFDNTATTSNYSTCIGAVIERFRDSTGAVITSGASMGWSVAGFATGGFCQVRQGGAWTTPAGPYPTGPPSSTDPDGRKRLPAFLIPPNYPGLGVLIAGSADIAAGDSGLAAVYGSSTHTYKAIANSGTLASYNSASTVASILGTTTAGTTERVLLLNE